MNTYIYIYIYIRIYIYIYIYTCWAKNISMRLPPVFRQPVKLWPMFKSSIWTNGACPWEIQTFKGHSKVKISSGSGNWDPRFDILWIYIMGADHIVAACSCGMWTFVVAMSGGMKRDNCCSDLCVNLCGRFEKRGRNTFSWSAFAASTNKTWFQPPFLGRNWVITSRFNRIITGLERGLDLTGLWWGYDEFNGV